MLRWEEVGRGKACVHFMSGDTVWKVEAKEPSPFSVHNSHACP